MFIAILLVVVGFTTESLAENPFIKHLKQHDADIKADIATHDTTVKNILNNTIKPNILTYDGNM